MKIQLMACLLGLTFSNITFANDENDQYFIAYNAAQTSKLPDVLKKQMQSAAMLDQIAVETLKKIGQSQLAADYYNRPDLQNKFRPLVQNFIISKAGGELFDDASTQLFSTTYNIDELKAFYQNNKFPEGQKFIQASMDVDLSTQAFINRSYKQKFDQISLDQLEADIQKIYSKYDLNQVSPNTQNPTTSSVAAQQLNPQQTRVEQTDQNSVTKVNEATPPSELKQEGQLNAVGDDAKNNS